MKYDIVIIGAGPAGMSAAIYAIRAGRTAVVFEAVMYGGQIASTPEVENFPSIQKISGWQLAQNIYEQAEAQGAEIKFENVERIVWEPQSKKVITESGNEYECEAVIIANGAKRRLLGCPGEKEFTGAGVSYCATCDGAFFKGKTVAVIGGGNSALEDALFLSNLCEKVYLIHRRNAFKGEKKLQDAVVSRNNIEIIFSANTKSILGDNLVMGIEIEKVDGGETRKLSVSAVFVAIGLMPDNAKFNGLVDIDKAGYIIADETCMTSVSGIFAAGDTRTKEVRQIITAAADGAVAALGAANMLNGK